MTDATLHAQQRVERARSDLGDTIDALKQKMSMSELIEEMQAQFLPDGGSHTMSRMMSSLSRQVQENPMALAMIGAGMAWLMMSGKPDGRGASSAPHADTGGGLGQMPAAAAGAAQESASNLASKVASGASQTASSASHALSEGASQVAQQAQHAAHSVSEGVAGAGQYVQDSSADLLEQYPLVFGAAAIAVGAAIGAALPGTAFENRQMGEASDNVREAAVERGSRAMDQAGAAARNVYETAKAEADKQGLMPEAGDGRTLVEKVAEVGRSATQAARHEVGRAPATDDGTSGPSSTASPKRD